MTPYKGKPKGDFLMKRKLIQNTEEEGITIIALIVTIVVMIILAGLTVYFSFGEDGAITQALISKKAHENATDEEQEVFNHMLEYGNYSVDGNGSPTVKPDTPPAPPTPENTELKEFKTAIAQTITNLGVPTDADQPVSKYITNIEKVGNQNYTEGVNSDLVIVGTGYSSRYDQSASVASVDSHELAVADDFIAVNRQMTYTSGNDGHNILSMAKNYDPSTGTITLGRLKSYNSHWTFWNIYDLYMIKRNPQLAVQAYAEEVEEETPPENIELNEFKNKLAEALNSYGFENVAEKSTEEISQIIQQFARNKFKEGVSTYMVLLQGNLNSRYANNVSATSIDQYQNLTLDRFLIVNTGLTYVSGSDGENLITMSKSYNNSNGVLSLGKQKSYTNDNGSKWTFFNTYNVYFLKKTPISISDL